MNINVIKVIDSDKDKDAIIREACIAYPKANALMLYDEITKRNFTILFSGNKAADPNEVVRKIKHPEKAYMLTLSRNHKPITIPANELVNYYEDDTIGW